MQVLSICLSAGAAALLESSFARSLAYERPIQTLILCFLGCASLLGVISRLYPKFYDAPSDTDSRYVGIPLKDLGHRRIESYKVEEASEAQGSSLRKQILCVVVGVVGLILRIEIYRRIHTASQCTSRSYEVFVPFLLALYDWRCQQPVHIEREEYPDSSVYDELRESVKIYVLSPAWRHIPSALLVSAGCYSVTALWSGQTSTYICPIASGDAASVPRLQQYALVLDVVLAIITDQLARPRTKSNAAIFSFPFMFGSILLVSASFWIGGAIVWSIAQPDAAYWTWLLDVSPRLNMFFSILWQIVLFCTLLITTLHCIMNYGVFYVATWLTAMLTTIPGIRYIWKMRHPFPPTTSMGSVWAFFTIIFGLWSLHRIRKALGISKSSISSAWIGFSLVLLIVSISPGMIKANSVYFHPIDLLMYDARAQHDRYIQYASHSKDLKTAVAVYQSKYQTEPPPGFDVWWEYAQNRSTTIIDDFDQIFIDLLPLRTTSPSELRRQTWEMVSNPWNEISGISIRGGEAAVQENVLPTHRWMLEGVAIFINKFAKHLPDMDLAFNLNDESRVAIPYDKITALRRDASKIKFGQDGSWSSDRDAGWLAVAHEEIQSTAFENWSFRNTFLEFGSVGCAPDTLARTSKVLSNAYLCTECAEPHSLSHFVSNWSLAADPCHQPDLAHLHGFYISPAAFKTSRQLLPVFSQSKAHGYNDILYPSAWNYMDKVKYDPVNASGVFGTDEYQPGYPDLPFSEKVNSLYWRGASSEGVSAGDHAWRGMTRQRFVHMTNNLTTSHHDQATLLLPGSDRPDRYTYRVLSAQSLFNLGLQTDVKMVDHIARCGGVDCTDQEAEFGLVGPADFQYHWKYRFLFDMDGAGFSGRFLPFLQSHSLPFKTAIFREWYDSRLTAWRHFVPQDIRLHGLWSTLAYFAGVDGYVDGKKLQWQGHLKEGELIAEEGRRWADTALRKEDMEIYFFRLLLEWGRLTDDRRDELGFIMTDETKRGT